MNTRIAVATALLTLTTGFTAYAQDTQTRSVGVRYKDLNFDAEAGRATMRHRLLSAANAVCELPVSAVDVAAHMDQTKCIKAAMKQAQVDLKFRLRPTMASR